MQEFIDDDDGYRGWLIAHPDAYVLNAERSPKPDYLRLHRVGCPTLRGDRPANGTNWTVAYRKVCGTRRELETWVRHTVPGGEI